MLQMVRTLAQFTIALEDMRELGEAGEAALLHAPASVSEEGPEKTTTGAGCSNRSSPIRNGTVEVTVALGDGWVGEGDRG